MTFFCMPYRYLNHYRRIRQLPVYSDWHVVAVIRVVMTQDGGSCLVDRKYELNNHNGLRCRESARQVLKDGRNEDVSPCDVVKGPNIKCLDINVRFVFGNAPNKTKQLQGQ